MYKEFCGIAVTVRRIVKIPKGLVNTCTLGRITDSTTSSVDFVSSFFHVYPYSYKSFKSENSSCSSFLLQFDDTVTLLL